MSRGLAENRKNKWKKIRERKQKYEDMYEDKRSYRYGYEDREIPDGVFANNHILNRGGHIKTRTKNAYASYRHKGGYGKAEKWSTHDQRQIEDMKQQVKEVEEGGKNVERK